MTKVVVFDSGFGSLSIIKAIQKISKAEIIYFADQKNFPYGKKSKTQLKKIISNSIHMLKKKFNPDLIVIGSNTPSLLLGKNKSLKILNVLPPLKQAVKNSKTSSIAILATQSVIQSKELENYIKKNQLSKKIQIKKINASPLIELVESGKFIENSKECKLKIYHLLNRKFITHNVDVVILSSTHLPFLLPYLKNEFPKIKFMDPAIEVAKKVAKKSIEKSSKKNTMKIFTSSNPQLFEKHLKKIGIKNKVSFLVSS